MNLDLYPFFFHVVFIEARSHWSLSSVCFSHLFFFCVNLDLDDVNGGFLDPEMVREARLEELAGYLKMQVYWRVPVAECGSHRVIQTRCVDTKKGDERSEEIRC